MKVRDIMSKTPITVDECEPVAAAARLMRQYNLGSLPVCDSQGHLRGMVTDRDIVTRCVASEMTPHATPVQAVMSHGLRFCSPDMTLDVAAQLMAHGQIRRIPVVEGDTLVGMVSLCDLARSGDDTNAANALAEISANIHRLG